MYEYNKVYQELADILNDKDVEKIYKNFRGMQVNFPMRLYSRDSVKKKIAKQKGNIDIKDLAVQTGYSVYTIRRMVNELKDDNIIQ
ncbi:DeoR family transcriptional regulator [Ligilactobacillus salivarius]|uniref:DeoR family transcriptional regulator n=1 Tax=Ligilactobacillus salivarius TaxID=1624 RepID=UPI001873480B|nr:DeoR family transcriptional regulator [Ligilactobacillus salivarius]MBE5066586.1 winged helix-turn-helix transcriptional regulator [Ligilactobacillus salivarius]MDM8284850.1 winged helix-turn-helix transcriptional regulator [Ligilactobacillus salivarius]